MKRLALLAALVACGPSARHAKEAPPPVLMQPPTATALGPSLAAIGFDPAHLPAFEDIPAEQRQKMMPLFAKSLGVPCEGCHAPSDFFTVTPRMRVAEQMWQHFVRALETSDKQPLFCDSCHHGSMRILDRKSPESVALWMDQSYVAKLARRDEAEHACPTCHGEPAEMRFIRFWAAGKPFPPKNSTTAQQVSR